MRRPPGPWAHTAPQLTRRLHRLRRDLRRAGLALACLAAFSAAPAWANVSRGNLDEPPYYDGWPKKLLRPSAHVPIRFQSEAGSMDPSPANSPALAAVMDSLNAELASIGLTVRLTVDLDGQRGPDVEFGCKRGGLGPDGQPRSPDELDTSDGHRMAFVVNDASKKWRERIKAAAADSVMSVISVQLGFGDYWAWQKDRKGNKIIALGHKRGMNVPWVTDLDVPVKVLQLTGVLLNTDGKAMRVGAEGLLARRSDLATVAGAAEVLTEDDLKALTAPRADGAGPVWRKALMELIARLLDPDSDDEEDEDEEPRKGKKKK